MLEAKHKRKSQKFSSILLSMVFYENSLVAKRFYLWPLFNEFVCVLYFINIIDNNKIP